MAKKKSLDSAIAILIVHAENCEGNAGIAGDLGHFEDKLFNLAKAAEYREAVKLLKASAK